MLLSQTSSMAPAVASLALSLFVLGSLAWLISVLVWGRRRRRDPLQHLDRVFQGLRNRGMTHGLWAGQVEFAGRKYRVTLTDRRVFAWLSILVEQWRAGWEGDALPRRLLAFRHDFRSLVRLKPIPGLIGCLRRSDRELRMIAIWLLGRCGSNLALSPLREFLNDPDPGIRRQVARALPRSNGFTELQSMAQLDPDPRIRRLASGLSASSRRPYGERLGLFVHHAGGKVFVARAYVSPMPLYLFQPIGSGKPPKTRAMIRRILVHIQQLVRGKPRNRIA